MKSRFPVYFLLFFFLVSTLYAGKNSADILMQQCLSRLTETYTEQYPAKGTKKALAVLPFGAESDKVRKAGLNQTVREIFTRKISTSQIFYLIDRDNLDAAIKEMKLSLSGLVDENQVAEIGNLAGAEVFLSGTVSELKENFVVTVKLTDVETGKVVAVETVEIPQQELYTRQREIEFGYISQYGLGINYQGAICMLTFEGCRMLMYNDWYINYRPYLWLNFKLGASLVSLQFDSYSSIPASSVFSELSQYSSANGYSQVSTLSAETRLVQIFSPYIGVDFNWTPVKIFTLGIGLVMNPLSDPIIEHSYSPGYYYDSSTNTIKKVSSLNVEQELDLNPIFRIEVKPQLFLSPRLTIGFYLSYILSGAPVIKKTLINGEYIQITDDGTVEAEQNEKYMGISPAIYGDGKDLAQVILMKGLALGFSINFFF